LQRRETNDQTPERIVLDDIKVVVPIEEKANDEENGGE
jgi:hypothetical protein